MDILAPAQAQEIEAAGWPASGTGVLPVGDDVTLVVYIDKVDFQIQASVSVPRSATTDNTKIDDLAADVQAALAGATWTVVGSNGGTNPAVGSIYAGFADDLGTGQPAIATKLREGRLLLASPYAFRILGTSSKAGALGFAQLTSAGLTSGLGYAVKAAGAGSTVTLGAPAGPNGKLYIAGKVLAGSAIYLNSGTSPDGIDIDVDFTGQLETLNGSITFDAGAFGDVKGNVIAGGTGSDVVITATNALIIRGTIRADRNVELSTTGAGLIHTDFSTRMQVSSRTSPVNPALINNLLDGKLGADDVVSVYVAPSASVEVTGTGAATARHIQIAGRDAVIVNGSLGGGLGVLSLLDVASTAGDLYVAHASGRLVTPALLTLGGDLVDVAGVIANTAATPAPDDWEVTISAGRLARIEGDLSAVGSILIQAASDINVFDASIVSTGAAGQVEIAAGQDAILGAIGVVTDSNGTRYYDRGAVLSATTGVTVSAGRAATVGAAVVVSTQAVDSLVSLSGDTVNLVGGLYAGASVSGSTTTWTGTSADVAIAATGLVTIGGTHFDGSGNSVPLGGSAQATGQLSILSGSLAVADGSFLIADARGITDSNGVVGPLTPLAPAYVVVMTTGDATVSGSIATAGPSTVTHVQAGGLLTIDGIVKAESLVELVGGLDMAGAGLTLTPLVVVRDAYGNQVNSDGRAIDRDGYLINPASLAFVGLDGKALAANDPPVYGGVPVRISGSSLVTGENGVITLAAAGNVAVQGMVGEVYVLNGQPDVKASQVQITSTADVQISNLVNARDLIRISGRNVSIVGEALVKARAAASIVHVRATDTLHVDFSTTTQDRAKVEAGTLVDLYGKTIVIDGSVQTRDVNATVMLNSIDDATITGLVTSSGRIEASAGVPAGLTEAASSAGGFAVASLVTGNLTVGTLIRSNPTVIHSGVLKAAGTITLRAADDLKVDAYATDGDDRSLPAPYLQEKEITIHQKVGTVPISLGTVSVSTTTYVPTTVTEQVGTEQVKVGSDFTTMDVVLTQDGFYNAATSTFREFFIEGVDYHYGYGYANGSYGYHFFAGSGGLYSGKSFNSLSDVDRNTLLGVLGYKPVYDFNYTNAKDNRTVDGIPTVVSYTPTWAPAYGAWGDLVYSDYVDRASFISGLTKSGYVLDGGNGTYDFYTGPQAATQRQYQVSVGSATAFVFTRARSAPKGNFGVYEVAGVTGLAGKYIRLPNGAQSDILRAVSTGSTPWSEKVGSYNDTANVTYVQDSSAFTSYQESKTIYDSLADQTTKTYYATLYDPNGSYDASPARWGVNYDANTGNRNFTINDGHSGSYGNTPTWAQAGNTDTETGSDALGRNIDAKLGYKAQTASIASQTTAATHAGVVVAYDPLATYHGRSYEYVAGSYNFWQAVSAAQYRSSRTVTFLAQPDNATQNEAIWQRIPIDKNAWIGGANFKTVSNGSPGWYWVKSYSSLTYDANSFSMSGDIRPVTYFDWNSGEPNNAGGNQFYTQFYGDGRDAWDDTSVYTNQGFVAQYEPYFDSAPITETQTDYRYNWTSTATNITDARATLNFQFVSNDHDIYGTRPKYATYNTTVPVVTTSQVTVWGTQDVFQDTKATVLERVYADASQPSGAFNAASIVAVGTIDATAGHDVSISGKVQATGAGSAVNLTAGHDALVQGSVPPGTTDPTVQPAVAEVKGAGAVRIVAGNDATVSAAGRLQVDPTAPPSTTAIVVQAGRDAVVEGEVGTPETVTFSAGRDLTIGAKVTARAGIAASAGVGTGIGSVTGDVLAELTTTGSTSGTTIALTAGATSGSIALPGSNLTTLGTATLTALGGSISQLAPVAGGDPKPAGLISSASLVARSASGLAANIAGGLVDAIVIGPGGISLASSGAVTLTSVLTYHGPIAVESLGKVTATRVETLGGTNDDDIAITTTKSDLAATKISAAGLGDVTLYVDGKLTGSSQPFVADALSIVANGGVDIQTTVNTLALFAKTAGLIRVNETDGIVLSDLRSIDGPITVTAKGTITAQSVVSLANKAADGILLNSTGGDVLVNLVQGGIYAADAAALAAIRETAGSSAVPTSFGSIEIDATGSIRKLTGAASAVNLVGDGLTLRAVTGITGLTTSVNVLSKVTTTDGSIDLVDVDSYGDPTTGLAILDAEALDNLKTNAVTVAITAASDLTVGRLDSSGNTVAGLVLSRGTASTVRLQSVNGRLFSYDNSTLDVLGSVVLLAGTLVRVKSLPQVNDRIEIRAGDTFFIKDSTKLNLTANTIIVQTGQTLVADGDLRGRDLVELDSTHGDVVVTGTVAGRSGALAQFTVNATGSGTGVASVVDPYSGFLRETDPQGRIYLYDAVNNLHYNWQDPTYGLYVFTGFNTSAGQTQTFWGTNQDPASGSLFTYNYPYFNYFPADRSVLINLKPSYTLVTSSSLIATLARVTTPVTINGDVTLSGGQFAATTFNFLSRAGKVATTGSARLTGTTLVAQAALGINLATAVNETTLSVTGVGDINVNEADNIHLANLTATNGQIIVTSGGTVTVGLIRSLTDAPGKDVTINAFYGSIYVDEIDAGTNYGKVSLYASFFNGTIAEGTGRGSYLGFRTDVWDSGYDIVAKTFSRYAAHVYVGNDGSSGKNLEVSNGQVVIPTNTGTVTLDRSLYTGTDAVATVTLRDADLTAVGSITVTVTTPSDPTGETITLFSTSPGVFSGTFGFESSRVAGNGKVVAADGQSIQVRYKDAATADGSSQNIDATAGFNIVPTVTAGAAQTAIKGQTVTFAGSFTDPGSATETYTYSWDFGDGSAAVTSTLTPTHAYAAAKVYDVTLTVTDSDGGVGVGRMQVTVNNAPPVVNAGGPYAADEGSTVVFTATGLDTLTYAWDVNFDGVAFHVTGTGKTYSTAFTNEHEGSVAVRATDSATNLSSISVAHLSIRNGRPHRGHQRCSVAGGQRHPDQPCGRGHRPRHAGCPHLHMVGHQRRVGLPRRHDQGPLVHARLERVLRRQADRLRRHRLHHGHAHDRGVGHRAPGHDHRPPDDRPRGDGPLPGRPGR